MQAGGPGLTGLCPQCPAVAAVPIIWQAIVKQCNHGVRHEISLNKLKVITSETGCESPQGAHAVGMGQHPPVAPESAEAAEGASGGPWSRKAGGGARRAAEGGFVEAVHPFQDQLAAPRRGRAKKESGRPSH
jgi:hypothetical protein